MAKIKTVYFCNECGGEQARWFGRCPICGAWGSCKEMQQEGKKNLSSLEHQTHTPQRLTDITASEQTRLDLGDGELNRVLGGGLVPGALVLLGGDPGIGKSTLLLQTLMHLPKPTPVLYCSGEESAEQIRLRSLRLVKDDTKDVGQHIYIAAETDVDQLITTAEKMQPALVVVDSIQTMATDSVDSSAGSVGQIRECAARLLKYAKKSNVPVILVGHITKEGSIAGPKVLEHIVDTVLQFEGDPHFIYRILRALKNRFGSTSEIGLYEMEGKGLREVTNPSEHLLSSDHAGLSGIAIAAAIEGARTFLIETQALVSTSVYATPMRSSTGFDGRRLSMLLAVLEKRVGFKLAQKDVFLNLTGGLRVSDTALDLSVLSAILSSNMDMALPALTCMTGEVGLSGEIRPVGRILSRITEASRLGFHRILIPKQSMRTLNTEELPIEVCPVSRVDEAFRLLFTD